MFIALLYCALKTYDDRKTDASPSETMVGTLPWLPLLPVNKPVRRKHSEYTVLGILVCRLLLNADGLLVVVDDGGMRMLMSDTP